MFVTSSGLFGPFPAYPVYFWLYFIHSQQLLSWHYTLCWIGVRHYARLWKCIFVCSDICFHFCPLQLFSLILHSLSLCLCLSCYCCACHFLAARQASLQLGAPRFSSNFQGSTKMEVKNLVLIKNCWNGWCGYRYGRAARAMCHSLLTKECCNNWDILMWKVMPVKLEADALLTQVWVTNNRCIWRSASANQLLVS